MLRRAARNGLRRVERLRARTGPHAAILLYHRVAEPVADPWNIAVSPENFAAHLEILKRYGKPLKMCDLVADLSSSGAARRSVAVTFDDGYRDNLTSALPALESHEVPATVYVVSGAIGHANAFWWEQLTRIFLEKPDLPATLSIGDGEAARHFELGEDATYDTAALARSAAWRADHALPEDKRQQVFLDVWSYLLELPAEERSRQLALLEEWAGQLGANKETEPPRPLGNNELVTFAASPLIEIGGHTLTHPDLERLPKKDAAEEIARCRHDLMEITGQEVTSFAYPFGRYAAHTAAQLREAGFTNAAWSFSGLATPRNNVFQLPRIHVPNLDPEEFNRLMHQVLGPAT